MTGEKRDIKSMTLEELEGQLAEKGCRAFRAGQIFQWIHEKLAGSFEEMTNLPKDLRERLSQEYDLITLKQEDVKVSGIDGTRKYLFGLPDGHVIESVLMKYKHGNSVCISSQVGCRMGCRFCASTLDRRNITVSTCGIVPGIEKLAEEGLGVTLALSLHAPDDRVRRTLMPVANRYPLEDVMRACETYFKKTGRRLTFEYSLVKGVNDNLAEARALAQLIKNRQGHVNLIPVNPIKERDYVQSGRKAVEEFKLYLEKNGINVTIRREMGRDINGACGQLRRSFMEQKS